MFVSESNKKNPRKDKIYVEVSETWNRKNLTFAEDVTRQSQD